MHTCMHHEDFLLPLPASVKYLMAPLMMVLPHSSCKKVNPALATKNVTAAVISSQGSPKQRACAACPLLKLAKVACQNSKLTMGHMTKRKRTKETAKNMRRLV
eukprot:TRINITY_DN10941_c0_g2_i5.p3 TRINITY_DN10941_c0_g2~~TRINITY_DN10941_c0_g2_i5.p3  ORF type:complete len:103 (-),score=20.69 TRINITY_DN10941_c0_g2_i5:479-787(-)